MAKSIFEQCTNVLKYESKTQKMVYERTLAVSMVALAVVALLFINIHFAEAHLIGSDVITKKVENYEVRFQPFPTYPQPERPTTLGFSILDQQGYNVWNVEASVKVQKDDATIVASPKTKYEISDFYTEYVFPEEGTYKVILEADIPEVLPSGSEMKTVRADFELVVGQVGLNTPALIALVGVIIGTVVVAILIKRRTTGTKDVRRR